MEEERPGRCLRSSSAKGVRYRPGAESQDRPGDRRADRGRRPPGRSGSAPRGKRCGGRSVRRTMTATYIEAISRGMWEEMERDKSVFLLGEDIGSYGGAFKATKGFLEHFGEERIVDTPLSEAAIVGAAVGAALVGMR